MEEDRITVWVKSLRGSKPIPIAGKLVDKKNKSEIFHTLDQNSSIEGFKITQNKKVELLANSRTIKDLDIKYFEWWSHRNEVHVFNHSVDEDIQFYGKNPVYAVSVRPKIIDNNRVHTEIGGSKFIISQGQEVARIKSEDRRNTIKSPTESDKGNLKIRKIQFTNKPQSAEVKLYQSTI